MLYDDELSPKGLKAINLTCMHWTCWKKKIKTNCEQTKKRISQNADQPNSICCDDYEAIWLTNFRSIFQGISFDRTQSERKTYGFLWCRWLIAFKRCLCSVSTKLQFDLCGMWFALCSVCACLRWLNRISFASVNCHNWSWKKGKEKKKIVERTIFLCVFIFSLVVNRDFFCGDLTVSYTLLLFTSRYIKKKKEKIFLVSRIFLCLLFCHFSVLTVGKYEFQPHFSQTPI